MNMHIQQPVGIAFETVSTLADGYRCALTKQPEIREVVQDDSLKTRPGYVGMIAVPEKGANLTRLWNLLEGIDRLAGRRFYVIEGDTPPMLHL